MVFSIHSVLLYSFLHLAEQRGILFILTLHRQIHQREHSMKESIKMRKRRRREKKGPAQSGYQTHNLFIMRYDLYHRYNRSYT